MKIIKTDKLVIKSWCDYPEEQSIEQAENLARLPFAFKHIALMPDCHMGFGMPIGGVLATKDYVIPNAVGVDIGCGMVAVKTMLHHSEISLDTLNKLMGVIRRVVPMGMGKNNKNPCASTQMPQLPHSDFLRPHIEDAIYQLGTLGSGNHFIEIQKDKDGFLWIMLHSGSRKLGKVVCDHYNSLATVLNIKYQSSVDTKLGLAFLPVDSVAGQEYLTDMTYATEFALLNRQKMMYEIMEAFRNVVAKYEDQELKFGTIRGQNMLNIHHNYASLENHFGQNVYVHRKGATSAKEGELGIIPGSQGTCSYIVRGLGNPESFMSCSHGAGRKMSRRQAQMKLDLSHEVRKMDDMGIVHSIRTVKDLDEAAGAYKDIDVVMEEQRDLVEIVYKLTPVAVLKGV